MGHGRLKPKKLGAKLRKVRADLLGGLTQAEMAEFLVKHGAEPSLHSGYISDYENDRSRAPSFLTLLAYSKATGLSVNVFIDDKLSLPKGSSSERR
jgi:transcriptional regulator with XRE-family HTH domain